MNNETDTLCMEWYNFFETKALKVKYIHFTCAHTFQKRTIYICLYVLIKL